MGEVYVAEHVGIQTRVAVKVLLPEISSDRDHVQRLFNEARLASRIRHAGITRIFDVGFHEGRAYLVMELLEGESLARRIQRGQLSEVEIVEIARQTANVLAATHAAGITHRDLKPDNIFLSPDAELACNERVKILDFGIAKLPGGHGPRTIGTMGTPDYMAPEQWGDSARVDWRADAYSLGCVLFEMAVGRPPFITSTIADAYIQHTQNAAPSPRACGSTISPELDAIIGRLLAKDPARRAGSMAEVSAQLGEIAGDRRTAETRAATERPLVGPRAPTTLGGSVGELATIAPSRGRGLVLGVTAAAFACIVAVGVIATRGRDRAVTPAQAGSIDSVTSSTTSGGTRAGVPRGSGAVEAAGPVMGMGAPVGSGAGKEGAPDASGAAGRGMAGTEAGRSGTMRAGAEGVPVVSGAQGATGVPKSGTTQKLGKGGGVTNDATAESLARTSSEVPVETKARGAPAPRATTRPSATPGKASVRPKPPVPAPRTPAAKPPAGGDELEGRT